MTSASLSTHGGATRIPEIAVALQLLFILRTIVALLLVMAGVACLYFGGQMLSASITSQAQSVLFDFKGQVTVTAGGFGAVVMTTSLVPFFLAYLARPTLELIPLGNGHYRIRAGSRHFARSLGLAGADLAAASDAMTASDASTSASPTAAPAATDRAASVSGTDGLVDARSVGVSLATS